MRSLVIHQGQLASSMRAKSSREGRLVCRAGPNSASRQQTQLVAKARDGAHYRPRRSPGRSRLQVKPPENVANPVTYGGICSALRQGCLWCCGLKRILAPTTPQKGSRPCCTKYIQVVVSSARGRVDGPRGAPSWAQRDSQRFLVLFFSAKDFYELHPVLRARLNPCLVISRQTAPLKGPSEQLPSKAPAPPIGLGPAGESDLHIEYGYFI